MNDHKYLVYLRDLWKQNWLLIAVWAGSGLFLLFLFWLFQQPADIAWIFLIFSGFCLLIYLGFYLRRLHTIKHLLLADDFDPHEYPQDQRKTLERLNVLYQQQQQMILASRREQKDLQDYFSLWAHQVKLPLAAMDLQLQLPNPDLKEIAICEKRIEACVSQAMAYIRLDVSDYQLQRIRLEDVVRPILRESASSFIPRRIAVDAEFDGTPVCTDKKWLAFVVEQLLSNALKYSKDGTAIQIESQPDLLIIKDEGCGIAPEDLPLIFEKGYTGKNGHENTSASSGLGLYLCGKICKMLGCHLNIQNRSDLDENGQPIQGVQAEIHFPETVTFKD